VDALVPVALDAAQNGFPIDRELGGRGSQAAIIVCSLPFEPA
jgi:hypothetical protein